MTYVLIGLRRSGKCLPTLFACANVRFRPSGYSPTAPMSFLYECLLRKSCTPGLPFFSLSFLQKGWMDGLGMPLCCFPRVFLSSRSTLVEREGWRSLWSRVRCTGARFLSPRFIRGLGIQELLSCGGLLLPVLVPVGSPSSALHARQGVGEGRVSVLGCLSRLISARSVRWWGG